jgi:hypothetical protein
MAPDDPLLALIAQMAHSPYFASFALGLIVGWTAARRTVRYMLGGRP